MGQQHCVQFFSGRVKQFFLLHFKENISPDDRNQNQEKEKKREKTEAPIWILTGPRVKRKRKTNILLHWQRFGIGRLFSNFMNYLVLSLQRKTNKEITTVDNLKFVEECLRLISKLNPSGSRCKTVKIKILLNSKCILN